MIEPLARSGFLDLDVIDRPIVGGPSRRCCPKFSRKAKQFAQYQEHARPCPCCSRKVAEDKRSRLHDDLVHIE